MGHLQRVVDVPEAFEVFRRETRESVRDIRLDSLDEVGDVEGSVAELPLPVVEMVGPVLRDPLGDVLPSALAEQVSVAVPREVRSGHVVCVHVGDVHILEEFEGILDARVGGCRVEGVPPRVTEEETLPVLEDYLLESQLGQVCHGHGVAEELAVADEMRHHERVVPSVTPSLWYREVFLVVPLDVLQIGDVLLGVHELVERHRGHFSVPLYGVPDAHTAGGVSSPLLFLDEVSHRVVRCRPTAGPVPIQHGRLDYERLVLPNELHRVQDEEAGIVRARPVIGAGAEVLERDAPVLGEDGVTALGTTVRENVEDVVGLL